MITLIGLSIIVFFFFFQAEDGIRDLTVTGVQTCALPISVSAMAWVERRSRRRPSARSSVCRRRLTVGWVVDICCAAAERLPLSTMRTKVCSSSMRSAPEGRERSAMVIRQAYIDSADAATTVGCCIAPHYGHRFSNTPYRRINMSCLQSAHNQAATSEKACLRNDGRSVGRCRSEKHTSELQSQSNLV